MTTPPLDTNPDTVANLLRRVVRYLHDEPQGERGSGVLSRDCAALAHALDRQASAPAVPWEERVERAVQARLHKESMVGEGLGGSFLVSARTRREMDAALRAAFPEMAP